MSELTSKEKRDLKTLDLRRNRFAGQAVRYGKGIGVIPGSNERFEKATGNYGEFLERDSLSSAVAKLYIENFSELTGNERSSAKENAQQLLMVSEAVKFADKQDEISKGKAAKAKEWLAEKTGSFIDKLVFLSEEKRESLKGRIGELGKTALTTAGILYVASEDYGFVSRPIGAYLGYRRGKVWSGEYGSQFARDFAGLNLTGTQEALIERLRSGEEFKLTQAELNCLADLKDRVNFDPQEIGGDIEENVEKYRKKSIALRLAGAAAGFALAHQAEGWFETTPESTIPQEQYDHLPSQDPSTIPSNMPTEEASPTNIDPGQDYELPDPSESASESAGNPEPTAESTPEEQKHCTVDGATVVQDGSGTWRKIGPSEFGEVSPSEVQCN